MQSIKLNVRKSKHQFGECLIDDSDAEKVRAFNWTAQKIGHHFYVTRKDAKNKTVLLHRFILGVTDRDRIVDHINQNTLDNRKENLRLCDKRLNGLNSRCKGYYFNAEKKKYHARVSVLLVNKYFESESDAKKCVERVRAAAIKIMEAV
jgi:hypothetical protein